MEPEVEGLELLINGGVENPFQVQFNKLFPVVVSNWNILTILLQIESPGLPILL